MLELVLAMCYYCHGENAIALFSLSQGKKMYFVCRLKFTKELQINSRHPKCVRNFSADIKEAERPVNARMDKHIVTNLIVN